LRVDVDEHRFGHYDQWWLAFGEMVWELRNNHPINPWVSNLLLPSNSIAYTREFNAMALK